MREVIDRFTYVGYNYEKKEIDVIFLHSMIDKLIKELKSILNKNRFLKKNKLKKKMLLRIDVNFINALKMKKIEYRECGFILHVAPKMSKLKYEEYIQEQIKSCSNSRVELGRNEIEILHPNHTQNTADLIKLLEEYDKYIDILITKLYRDAIYHLQMTTESEKAFGYFCFDITYIEEGRWNGYTNRYNKKIQSFKWIWV